MERKDDFEQRRQHLKQLTEQQLEERFWDLCNQLMDPIAEIAAVHTTPSIERSVLLRMGFSSMESHSIVQGAIDRGLLGHGAGHLVYRLAKEKGMDIRKAGQQLAENRLWEETKILFPEAGK